MRGFELYERPRRTLRWPSAQRDERALAWGNFADYPEALELVSPIPGGSIGSRDTTGGRENVEFRDNLFNLLYANSGVISASWAWLENVGDLRGA